MSATKTRKHACARCGRRDTADRMIYSRFTCNHYCGPGRGCQKRARSAA